MKLATGGAEQALADFIAAGEAAESVDIRNPAYIPWRSQSALALRQLERIDEAQALARDELELSRRWGAPRAIGVSLRALGVVEGGEAGEQLLREAVDVLASSPARLEQARALIDLGAALRRGNSRDRGSRLLATGDQARTQMRGDCARRARESGARRDRCPSAHDHAERARRADGKRTPRGANGRART